MQFCSLLDNVSNMLPQTIALNLKYPNETVKHVAVDEGADIVLSSADLVIYGSFLEEHTFPDILLKAMCFGKPIIAPDLPMIRKYVGIYSLYSLIKFAHIFCLVTYFGCSIIGQGIACLGST